LAKSYGDCFVFGPSWLTGFGVAIEDCCQLGTLQCCDPFRRAWDSQVVNLKCVVVNAIPPPYGIRHTGALQVEGPGREWVGELQVAARYRSCDLPHVQPAIVTGLTQVRDISRRWNAHRVSIITLVLFEVLTLDRMH
jgi:hypothetical protein